MVATTDVLVEDRHFRRDWSSARDIGRKAAAQNLADVAAMGARPTALLVGFGAPPELAVTWVEELAGGLAAEAASAGAAVVGGDMTAAAEIVIAVTALGDLGGRAPVTRGGARPGDLVVVAGRLGWAAAGLRLMQAGLRSGQLVDAHRCPQPPYQAGVELSRTGATSMIDVSDGLVGDLGHVAVASGVRIDLALAALRPLATKGVRDDDILAGGDDHALAATLPADVARAAGWPIVGAVSAGEGVWVDGVRDPGPGGHRHWS